MKMVILLAATISILLLLIGCEPIECEPTIVYEKCNNVSEDINGTEGQINTSRYTIFDVPDINSKMIVYNDKFMDIWHCGTTAQGAVTSEYIKEFKHTDWEWRYIIIDNTDSDHIGGCPDVLRAIPDIKEVHIYGRNPGTEEYDEVVLWTPIGRLVIKEYEEFII